MIEMRQICKTFVLGEQPVRALNAVDLHIAAGEYLSVMGPSGSGKSTLLNVIGLLEAADSGDYWLDGEEVGALDEEARAHWRRRHIGFVFQAYHLLGRLTAFENVELPLTLAGVAPAQRRRRVGEVLQKLELSDRASHLPQQLSGGQRQRVAIARAIVTRPKLLLADEPTGNLDSRAGAQVVALLEALNAEGITLMVVTHDAALGRRARRRLLLADGRVQSDEVAVHTEAEASGRGGDAPCAS